MPRRGRCFSTVAESAAKRFVISTAIPSDGETQPEVIGTVYVAVAKVSSISRRTGEIVLRSVGEPGQSIGCTGSIASRTDSSGNRG